MYDKYKGNAKEKPYRETMFYSVPLTIRNPIRKSLTNPPFPNNIQHLLALPFFLILLPDMIERVEFWKTLTPITIPWLEVSFPVIWFHLICNVITQWICIRGVFMLTGMLFYFYPAHTYICVHLLCRESILTLHNTGHQHPQIRQPVNKRILLLQSLHLLPLVRHHLCLRWYLPLHHGTATKT